LNIILFLTDPDTLITDRRWPGDRNSRNNSFEQTASRVERIDRSQRHSECHVSTLSC